MRPGLVALASSLVPGWGHRILGRRPSARALVVVDVLILVSILVSWVMFRDQTARAWVDPEILVGLLAANVMILGYRGVVTTDSFLRSRPKLALDWAMAGVAAVLVVTPHLIVGNLVWAQYDMITTVFAGPPSAAPEGTSTTAPQPSSSTAVTTTTTATPTTTTTQAVTTSTAQPRFWDGTDRLNVMLLGSDAGVGRIGTRTDTVILLSVDPETGEAAMFSVPRNLTEAPLPEGMGRWSCNCFPDIITHLWANGEWYPDAFPGPQSPSVNALKASLGLIFDLEVHYYAKVDLVGFVEIVDALGGVTVDVPQRIVDESYPHEEGGRESVVIEAGPQFLDGHRALAYSRIRRYSGDFARMHRQRCVIRGLVNQAGLFDFVTGYDEFADAVKDHVETDIPLEALGDIVELLGRVDIDEVATLRITRYNYVAGGHAGYQLYDLERIREDARRLIADPTTVLPTQDAASFAETCELSFD